MINALSIAQSGLLAATAQLNVAANNIANLNTPGYQQQSVDLYSNGNDGVELGEGGGIGAADDASGINALDDENANQPANNVDLATQSVNLLTAKLMYNANADVVRTADQMVGTLLNVLDRDDSDNAGDGVQ